MLYNLHASDSLVKLEGSSTLSVCVGHIGLVSNCQSCAQSTVLPPYLASPLSQLVMCKLHTLDQLVMCVLQLLSLHFLQTLS